jgi:hypothetical protein
VPDKATRREAYRRAAAAIRINKLLPKIVKRAMEHADGLKVPTELDKAIRQKLEHDPHIPWDRAVTWLVGETG